MMNKNSFETAKSPAKHWYLLFILGAIFVLMGIWILRTPVNSLIALTVFFAVTFLVSGIFETIYAITNRKVVDNWAWNLAGGVVDLLIGILLIANPDLSIIFLLFYVGFALIFRAVMTIGWAVLLNKMGFRNWAWVLAAGILGLLVSFLLLLNPAITGFVIVIYLAIAFIMLGIAQIVLSFRLKRLNKNEY